MFSEVFTRQLNTNARQFRTQGGSSSPKIYSVWSKDGRMTLEWEKYLA